MLLKIKNGEITDSQGKTHSVRELVDATNNNFTKMHVTYAASMLEHMGDAKMKIVGFIMDNISYSKNELNMTVREIAKKTNTSTRTVSRTLHSMEKAGIIKRRIGTIMLTPVFMFKGGGKSNSKQRYSDLLIHFIHFGDSSIKNRSNVEHKTKEKNFSKKKDKNYKYSRNLKISKDIKNARKMNQNSYQNKRRLG